MECIINAIIENDLEWFSEQIKTKGPDLTDSNGFTPLMYCIQNDRNEMIDFLLDQNANINKQNKAGNTALFYAVFCSKNKIDIIEKLLNKGADMNLQNKSGISPLSLANTMANKNVANFMNNWKK